MSISEHQLFDTAQKQKKQMRNLLKNATSGIHLYYGTALV